MLWLQGGPGGSSLFGLFIEHGPFFVDEALALNEREISWSKKYNMLYIDQPAGTGFSFTDDARGYATNQYDVSKDLYEALSQFYKLFPGLLKNDFFVTGESYGGEYETCPFKPFCKMYKSFKQKIIPSPIIFVLF